MNSMQNPTGSENTDRSQSCPTPSTGSSTTTSTGASSGATGTSTGTSGSAAATTSTGKMQNEYHKQLSHLTEGTQETSQRIQEQASDVAQQVKEKAYEAMEASRQKAMEASNRVKDRSQEVLNNQKDRLAGRLHQYSEVFHDAANRFRDEKDPNIAEYSDMIADGIDCASTYLKQKNVNNIIRDTEKAVYYRPVWFLGGMFLAGVALARFIKASRTQRFEPRRRWSDQDYYGMGTEEFSYGSSTYRESYANEPDYGFEERRKQTGYRQSGNLHTPERRASGPSGYTPTGVSNPAYSNSGSSTGSRGSAPSEIKSSYGSSSGGQTSGTGTASYGSGTSGTSGTSQRQAETTLHPTGAGSSSQQASGGSQASGLGSVKTSNPSDTQKKSENIYTDKDKEKTNADSPKSKEYDL